MGLGLGYGWESAWGHETVNDSGSATGHGSGSAWAHETGYGTACD